MSVHSGKLGTGQVLTFRHFVCGAITSATLRFKTNFFSLSKIMIGTDLLIWSLQHPKRDKFQGEREKRTASVLLPLCNTKKKNIPREIDVRLS